MSFEKGDKVVLHDKHSDFDGETGEVKQVSKTMFNSENYTVEFDDGREQGVSEDMLEPAGDNAE